MLLVGKSSTMTAIELHAQIGFSLVPTTLNGKKWPQQAKKVAYAGANCTFLPSKTCSTQLGFA